ncbi:hypothetical protein ACFQ36_11605 [Arthrobacter sp. GCM10027362]|uniref:hypothetical protein n=1 Tax=Arthrobacter sp. GCM10027362 TaxID=3273379 RepID=UPI003645C45E
MRWDALFADLEAQLYSAGQLALETETNERARMDQAALALTDRLRGQLGAALRVRLAGGVDFDGQLSHVGSTWIVLDEPTRSVLVTLDAVQLVEGLGRSTVPQDPGRPQRLGLASALRALARDREEVLLYLSPGRDGGFRTIAGTVDRVGKDFLEIAAVPLGEARRAGNVRGVYAVPFNAVAAVASARRS